MPHFVVMSDFHYEGQEIHAVFLTVDEARAFLKADEQKKYPNHREADIVEWEGDRRVKEWPRDPNAEAIVVEPSVLLKSMRMSSPNIEIILNNGGHL